MTLTISLSQEIEDRLRQRARAAGIDLSQFVEKLIALEMEAPLTLEQAAEPFARAIDAAGVSDDEFLSILNEARDAARKDRRKKP